MTENLVNNNIITEATAQETPLNLNTEDNISNPENERLEEEKEKETKTPKKSKKPKSGKKAKKKKVEKIQSPEKEKKEEKKIVFQPVVEDKKIRVPNEIRKYEYIYSPRTTFSKNKIYEDKLFHELSIGFDPITIKIIKSHFKERLGALTKYEFISICKNHLLSWHPNLPNRKNVLIKPIICFEEIIK